MAAPPVTACDERFALGEGPVWDRAGRRLLWVDIVAGTVLEGRLDGPRIEVTRRHRFDGTVGAALPTQRGEVLVVAADRLVLIEADGTRRAGPRLVPDGTARRCNDAAVDPAGRLVVGTLSLAGPSTSEVLVRVEHDGSVTVLDSDLTMANGIAWSVDGTRMFTVDTLRGVVHVRDHDVATGAVGPRRVHIAVDGPGTPDGIAVDAEDHLWVAIWGRGEVRRHRPDGGDAVATVAVPAPHVSSVAFAGDDLATMVITTATDDLTDQQLLDHPGSGRVYTAAADVPGAPTHSWRGVDFDLRGPEGGLRLDP